MKYKKTKEDPFRKVNMLQCPSSLKQMNFKTECFSSLLLTINTEVIIFNIRLSTITKFNHEIQEQWHFAPMLNSSMSSLLGAFDFSASVKGIYVKSSSYLDFEEIFVVAAITKVIYEANAAKERSWPEFSNVQSSRAVLAPSSSPGLF